jgi:hypothetical protein
MRFSLKTDDLAKGLPEAVASAARGGTRLLSASAGTNQAVSPSAGWTATAKPKFDNGAARTSVQWAPLSTLRQMPL